MNRVFIFSPVDSEGNCEYSLDGGSDEVGLTIWGVLVIAGFFFGSVESFLPVFLKVHVELVDARDADPLVLTDQKFHQFMDGDEGFKFPVSKV